MGGEATLGCARARGHEARAVAAIALALATAVAASAGCGRSELLPPAAAGDSAGRPDAASDVAPRSVELLALGTAASCALLSDGTARCWGNPIVGAIGAGDPRCDQIVPRDVPGLTGAIQLAAGAFHVCAAFAGGGVACWGDNSSGQLGDGTTTSRIEPVTAAGVSGAVELALGPRSSCARTAAGAVRCWGDAYASPPADVKGISGATQIAVSSWGSCAVIGGQTVACWGPDLAIQTIALGGAGVRRLSLGFSHACAALADGTVRCWGSNDKGELGDGTTVRRADPVPVLGLADAVDVAAGYQYSCARSAGGTVRCWGTDFSRKRVDGSYGGNSIPAVVAFPGGGEGARALAVGADHACARLGDGSVWCWGSDLDGQLGDGRTASVCAPVPVVGLSPALRLAAGSQMTCATEGVGQLVCWGLVTEAPLWTAAPVAVAAPDPLLAAGVAIGLNHACLLRPDGSAACWGSQQLGQLGDGMAGDYLQSPVPVAVRGLAQGARAIAAGEAASCALLLDGSAACWGYNVDGQLGDGTTINRALPAPVLGLRDGTALAMANGGDHACALLADRTVSCWGANGSGQLGDGTTINRATPVPVPGLRDAVEIALGAGHSCARHADGGASCWGDGVRGQLGDGAVGSGGTFTPQRIAGLAGVEQIAAGGSHTCARLAGGGVACWGANDYGQLGDGTRAGRAVPTPVPGLAGAVALALGAAHSCAQLADGRVACWGDNFAGQLGIDWDSARAVPVVVAGLP